MQRDAMVGAVALREAAIVAAVMLRPKSVRWHIIKQNWSLITVISSIKVELKAVL